MHMPISLHLGHKVGERVTDRDETEMPNLLIPTQILHPKIQKLVTENFDFSSFFSFFFSHTVPDCQRSHCRHNTTQTSLNSSGPPDVLQQHCGRACVPGHSGCRIPETHTDCKQLVFQSTAQAEHMKQKACRLKMLCSFAN